MTAFVSLPFSPCTWDLMCVMSFSWYLALARPPCLFFTARKRQFFHTHTFPGPAYLTDILHSNHHISRRHYNYSADVLLVYLDISHKYLLVKIIQAFCFSSRTCLALSHWYIWNTNCGFAYINLIRIVLPSLLPKCLNKRNNVCNVI